MYASVCVCVQCTCMERTASVLPTLCLEGVALTGPAVVRDDLPAGTRRVALTVCVMMMNDRRVSDASR